MEKVLRSTTIYKSEDGREFLTEKECSNYENNVLKKKKNIVHFSYLTDRDLTETGRFYYHNYAAVYIKGYDDCYKDVLMQYLLDGYGRLISENVQGYGVTSMFSVSQITEEEYFEKKPNIWGGSIMESKQILLSEIPIDGYPENIKIISKHINKYK